MAGRYNQWLRAKLAARIEDNGGYHGHRESHALSWRVYFFGLNDAEEAARLLVEHEHFVCEADLMLQFPDFAERFDDENWLTKSYSSAQELLQNDLGDDEGMRMWRPETAARYGFDYKGAGADHGFDMELNGHGGGGKHVCLDEFEGVNLRRSRHDIAERVSAHLGDDGYDLRVSNKWCRKLMGIMDELDEALTSENAERCGRYYQTDWLARELGIYD